jgi:hypothetical protein
MMAAVEHRDVLAARVQDVLEQLAHVEQAMRAPIVDDHLLKRVAVRFAALIGRHRATALRLRQDLQQGGALDDGWARLDELRADCAPLFAESLAAVHGALARVIELDRGLCRVADALVEDLADLSECPWERFTVLAEGEHVDDLADIIRLRFPDVSVWSLPVAAHEFGHVVASALEDSPDLGLSGPFKRARAQGESAWAHAHEQFADCYATYVLGPAYVATCVIQRFDPPSAARPDPMHPDTGSRVAMCLDVLERMDRAEGLLKPFAGVAGAIRETWDVLVADASDTAEPTVVCDDALVDRYWSLLDRATPEARYCGWQRAEQTARKLLRQFEDGLRLDADAHDARDVINAAWFARLTGPPAAAARLGEWATAALSGSDPAGRP